MLLSVLRNDTMSDANGLSISLLRVHNYSNDVVVAVVVAVAVAVAVAVTSLTSVDVERAIIYNGAS